MIGILIHMGQYLHIILYQLMNNVTHKLLSLLNGK